MDFRILGALDFAVPGQGRVTPRGKRMELLAVLLLRRNEVVTVDRIIEHLWDSSPPRSATRNIRTYAWQLRRELGGQSHRLAAAPGGYSISCTPDELDLARFRSLTASGYEALRADDGEAAARRFRDALDLWRGEPFGGANLSQHLRAEADWIVEERLSVFEALMDADLSRGAYQEVIQSVGREIIHYPLREGLYERLMKALSRSGRQRDALALYRRARRTLRAEMGVEPASELRHLYGRLLAAARER